MSDGDYPIQKSVRGALSPERVQVRYTVVAKCEKCGAEEAVTVDGVFPSAIDVELTRRNGLDDQAMRRLNETLISKGWSTLIHSYNGDLDLCCPSCENPYPMVSRNEAERELYGDDDE